jgi:hypothetical protein
LEIKRLAAAVLALMGVACSGKHSPVTVQNEEESAPATLAVVRMNDAKAAPQLLTGFYALENNSWRWTAGKFSILLRTPLAAAQRGGTLTFSLSIPDVLIQRLKTVTLTGSINGMALKTVTYDKAGPNVFTADISPALLAADTVTIEFALDKTIPPDVDKRALGIVATSIGLASK